MAMSNKTESRKARRPKPLLACKGYRASLKRLADGDLYGRWLKRVEDHLVMCRRCSAVWERKKKVKDFGEKLLNSLLHGPKSRKKVRVR